MAKSATYHSVRVDVAHGRHDCRSADAKDLTHLEGTYVHMR